MRTTWTGCPVCKFTEKTSPHVKEIKHVHGKTEYQLTPFRKERKTPGADTVKSLKAEVWDIFSEYIRRKYADKDGYVQCVTCGKRDHWKNMQAGHYFSRRHGGTFLDEQNVHVQCPLCNGFGHGESVAYREFIINTYGQGALDRLEYLKSKPHQFKKFELEQLKRTYLAKIIFLQGSER
jgi:hypothetical protein